MPSSTPRLVIVGAGGHAREAAWLASACDAPWTVLGHLDDRDELQDTEIGGLPVIGRIDDWIRCDGASAFFVAIGAPRLRRSVVERMEALGRPRFASLVHRSVIRSGRDTVGDGSMVAAGCVLSTDVQIGRHVILNIGCSVSHDTSLGDYATVAPRVAVPGAVQVEPGAELGIGCSLRQGLRIGRGAMVGMGAVVTRDVAPRDVVIGCPARPMHRLDDF